MIKKSDFETSIRSGKIPPELSIQLQALWHDGRGNWKAAHNLVDQLGDKQSAHLHAYLHRKEGDLWNADYWYKRAGVSRPKVSLETEWDQLVDLAFNLH
jgi:hypothetical protein